MKTILLLLAIVSCLLGGMSCVDVNNENNSGPPIYEVSYIQGFYKFKDLHIFPIGGILADKTKNEINLSHTNFDKPVVYKITDGVGIALSISGRFFDWRKGGIYTGDYYKLVEQIGDTSYNSKKKFSINTHGYIIAVADTLQSINITCDKQFDENHPAGSSLNDLFSIYLEDPCATIKNGYKSSTGSDYYSLTRPFAPDAKTPYSLFGAKLTSVNLVDKPHIGYQMFLGLDVAPENTGEYVFTVSITDKQGKTIEKTADNPIQIEGLK